MERPKTPYEQANELLLKSNLSAMMNDKGNGTPLIDELITTEIDPTKRKG
ncbi:MAG: hypothetical protein ACLQM6_11100 [Acidobacteriaceae bacterium]